MRWKHLVTFVLLAGVSGGQSFGQNLVPNPHFDEYSACPDFRGLISYAPPWYTPNGRTTDFAHECAGADNFAGVPKNRWGIEQPAKGRGYAGIRTWLNREDPSDTTPYREYLAVELTDTLQAGVAYSVRFKLSIGDSAKYTTDDIGVAFSNERFLPFMVLPFEPVVSNPQGRIIYRSNGWEEVSGQFIATGDEVHMAIGNFFDEEETTVIDRNRVDAQVESTYFYIDDVVVEPCQGLFPEEMILAEKDEICPEEELLLRIAPLPEASYVWDNNTRDTVRSIQAPGRYTLTSTYLGCIRRDTLLIGEAPVPDVKLGADTAICLGSLLVVDLPDSSNQYRWEDQSTDPVRLISEAGTYVLEASNGICRIQDTLQVSYVPPISLPDSRDTFLCRGQELRLQPELPHQQYLWSDLSEDSVLVVREAGTYWVDVSTACEVVRTYYEVSSRDCGCESFIPNVFTPNGDGINDQFRPQLRNGISDFQLKIFDRWGTQVFESHDPSQHWEGTQSGVQAPEGVYYWMISYRCYDQSATLTRQLYKGHLSLLR